MKAYLLLPSIETGASHRVDFGNIGHLFVERDEAPAVSDRASRTRFVLTGLLILICAVGDAVLVMRPDALTQAAFVPHARPNAERAVTL